MMTIWKIGMPHATPDEGCAHFAFAMKKGDGQRVELFGQLPIADVTNALQGLIEAQNLRKAQRSLVCGKCGANRMAEPCKGDLSNCEMKAEAQPTHGDAK
jgi:hypothetical protein